MKETFDIIFPDLMQSEGGFSNDPKDPGGATYKGITLTYYRLHVDAKATVATLKALTDQQVHDYYKKFYWDTVKGDLLPAGIDYSVFDFGVNSGQATAVMKLQRIVGTTSDGVVGNQTLAAVAQFSQSDLIDKYNSARLDYLKRLPGWSHDGNGWTNRVNRVQKKSQELFLGQGVKKNEGITPNPTLPVSPVPQNVSHPNKKNLLDLILFLLGKLFHV